MLILHGSVIYSLVKRHASKFKGSISIIDLKVLGYSALSFLKGP
jgi:hypothetical protein